MRAAAIIGVLIGSTACGPSPGPRAGGMAKGPRAPDFTLPTLDGGDVTLSDFEGDKVVLLDFWATNCDPCKAELPEIVKLYEEKRDAGLVVLAISIDPPETLSLVTTTVGRMKMGFPVLLDRDTEVFDRYSPKGVMPYTAVVDRAGVLRLRRTGYEAGDTASWNELIATIDAALAE